MVNLTFKKNASNRYVASFVSTGEPTAVQVQRKEAGDLIVYANVGTMPKVVLQGLSRFYAGRDWLRTINVPANVTVTIESETEVTTGGYE